NQTSDSSAIVDFYGLDPNENYSAVLLRTVKGVSSDVGGKASLGGSTIENVNAAWADLKATNSYDSYVLTAEGGSAVNNANIGNGVVGTGYNDTFSATLGTDIYNGGGGTTIVSGERVWSNTGGIDIVDYRLAGTTSLNIDLSKTTAQNTGFGNATFVNIEGLAGGQGSDTFTGNAGNNYFEGRGGNDVFNLDSAKNGGGQDTLMYKVQAGGSNNGTGGNGSDTVNGFWVGTVEATKAADIIDVSNLLVGYSASADGAAHYINGVATIDAGETIGQYLTVTYNGKDTVVSIDRDGSGGAFNSTTLLTLTDTQADLATLLANHQLILTSAESAGTANFSALSEGMTANLWTGFNSAGEQLQNITSLVSTSGDD
ncbi:type I secretion C-terminal target domain-containing protein, partial [Trabulsiella odontotermitis]|uniref:type I secretion C-terminal target domain-containing protein n=1 Tax=Trabulsiella odontotermitis TaxID=379893 RepID=UPI000ADDC9B0